MVVCHVIYAVTYPYLSPPFKKKNIVAIYANTPFNKIIIKAQLCITFS